MDPNLVICSYMAATEIGKYTVQMGSVYKYREATIDRQTDREIDFLPHYERKTNI